MTSDPRFLIASALFLGVGAIFGLGIHVAHVASALRRIASALERRGPVALVLVALLGAVGCWEDPPPPVWRTAPYTYRCTADEAERVERETTACYGNGWGYTRDYCYGSAIARICSPPCPSPSPAELPDRGGMFPPEAWPTPEAPGGSR